MLSRPALVRVSATITRPSRTRTPQQYVMTSGLFLKGVASALRLGLRLLARLVDVNRDFQRFAVAAVARAAHRRGAEIIQPGGDPHMRVGRADAVARIEADPAEVVDIAFRPGVAGVLRRDAVGAVE